jgi:predicted deacylase
MRPDEMDETFVPCRRDDVAAATLDHETVIHDRARLFHLDPIATVVWESCDGTISVDALASELGATFRVDPDTARVDVLGAVRALAADGLLDGVEATPVDAAVAPGASPGSPPRCVGRSRRRA